MMTEEKAAAKKEYARQWRQANREKMRAYRAAYRQKNAELLAVKREEWVAANPERVKELKARWYRENKEKSAESARRSSMMRLYGITPEERDQLLVSQGNKCAVCGSDEPCGKGWHVDHCHSSGKVRGVLCNHCNLMLGYARDNSATLQAAIQYLERGKE